MHAPHPVRPRPAEAGFTLVEIVITLALIVTLATVAVPNYLSSRATANESAAVATLRSISTAQASFRNTVVVDRDGDGAGEYGTLGELTGSSPLPVTGELLSPPMLPITLGDVDGAGRTLKSGYWFSLHLPDAAGAGVAATTANRGSVDAELAEQHWTCLAWPLRQGASGVHTFFVNEQGEIRKNRSARYSGAARVPPAGAALLGTGAPERIAGSTGIATNGLGADGETWLVVE